MKLNQWCSWFVLATLYSVYARIIQPSSFKVVFTFIILMKAIEGKVNSRTVASYKYPYDVDCIFLKSNQS